jgi:ABC-type branched-subunit amino acid transport system substrate-binding protein
VRRIVPILLLTIAGALTRGNVTGQEPSAPSRPPDVDFRRLATPYEGPGREQEEPADIAEVRIGYFGPSDPADPEGGDLWRAADWAVGAANQQGGYRGKPFRLVPCWSPDPWRAGISQLARMVYRDRVWAIVGGIDGSSAHLAEQVVAKARLPLVCPASTDRTANVANVPWIVSMLPGDDRQAPVLVEALLARGVSGRFAVLSTADHDAHRLALELDRACKRKGLAPRLAQVLGGTDADDVDACRELIAGEIGGIVILTDASHSARLVRRLRADGFRGAILGGPTLGRRAFLEGAGADAEGVLFPLLFDPETAPPCFVAEFRARFAFEPDHAAAATYDGVNLLIAAIRKAGLNRAKIGDALHDLTPWQGVTGPVSWDRLGTNSHSIGLGTIRAGHPVRAESSSGR